MLEWRRWEKWEKVKGEGRTGGKWVEEFSILSIIDLATLRGLRRENVNL